MVSQENMTLSSGPWSKVKPLTVFKNPDLIDCPRGIEVRLMWDDDNVYVAYKVPNEKIGTDENPYDNVPPLTADGSWWNGGPEFMETYLCGNMTNMSEYSAFYTDAIDQQIQYNVGPAFAKGPYAWESHSAIHAEGEPEERYWMNVLVIPFETLGVTSKTATLGGTFVANVYGDPGPYYGWCGSNVWSTASFRLIKLVDGSGEPTDKTALKDLCDSYENLENDGYTEESWNAFQEALAKAKDILADENASQAEADEAKACVGYLPEQPPLYPEMTVWEYLNFAAELKKVPRAQRKEQVLRAARRTGLEKVLPRLIRSLSKGYRQRVGIAQALLGSPKIIILDEPTVGLDPAQVIEMRKLIRELGKAHTVILSSHILSEVQAVCQQVLILSKGKLAASGTLQELTADGRSLEEVFLALTGAQTDPEEEEEPHDSDF